AELFYLNSNSKVPAKFIRSSDNNFHSSPRIYRFTRSKHTARVWGPTCHTVGLLLGTIGSLPASPKMDTSVGLLSGTLGSLPLCFVSSRIEIPGARVGLPSGTVESLPGCRVSSKMDMDGAAVGLLSGILGSTPL
uniref:Uncharacterized protein n=1 Tax=Oryza brachyantha TaxID=4533 RepID=J3MFD6_ORYBR